MQAVKDKITEIIMAQPDDASYEEMIGIPVKETLRWVFRELLLGGLLLRKNLCVRLCMGIM